MNYQNKELGAKTLESLQVKAVNLIMNKGFTLDSFLNSQKGLTKNDSAKIETYVNNWFKVNPVL